MGQYAMVSTSLLSTTGSKAPTAIPNGLRAAGQLPAPFCPVPLSTAARGSFNKPSRISGPSWTLGKMWEWRSISSGGVRGGTPLSEHLQVDDHPREDVDATLGGGTAHVEVHIDVRWRRVIFPAVQELARDPRLSPAASGSSTAMRPDLARTTGQQAVAAHRRAASRSTDCFGTSLLAGTPPGSTP